MPCLYRSAGGFLCIGSCRNAFQSAKLLRELCSRAASEEHCSTMCAQIYSWSSWKRRGGSSWPCPAGSGWLCAGAGTLASICCAQGAAARAWGLSGLWALALVRASSAAEIDLKASIRRSYKSWTQPNCLLVPSAPFPISRRQHRRAIALPHFSGGLIESSLVFPVQVLGKLSFIMSCAANEISISQINCSNFLPLEWLDVALEVLLSSANSHWALMHRGKAPSP